MPEGNEIVEYKMPKYFPKPENPTEELFWKESDQVPPIKNFLNTYPEGGLLILLQHIALFRHNYAEVKDKWDQALKRLQKAQKAGEDCSEIQKEWDKLNKQLWDGVLDIVRPFGITSEEELLRGFESLRDNEWDQISDNRPFLRLSFIVLNTIAQKQQQEAEQNLRKNAREDAASENAAQQQIEKITKALGQLFGKMNKLNGIVENAEYINNILPFRQLSELIQSNVENLSKIESNLQNNVDLFRAAVSGHIRKQTIVSSATRYNEKKSDHQNDFLTSNKIQELLSSLNEKVINTREMIGTNNGQNMYDFLNTIEKKQESLKQQMDITNALLLKILQTSSRTSNEDIRAIVENNR